MLFNSKNSGLVFAIVIFLGLNLSVPDLSTAQNSDKMMMENHNSSFNTSSNRSNSNLNYSDNRKGVSVKEALEFVSDKVGLVLSYRSGLFLNSERVSMNLGEMKFNKAMETILSGTGLKYEVTETRHLVIYPKDKVGHIKGGAINVYSREPLKGAKVLLVDVDNIDKPGSYNEITKSTIANSSGEFVMNNIEAGTYRLIIIDNGIKKVYKKVQIKDKKTTVENLRLKYLR